MLTLSCYGLRIAHQINIENWGKGVGNISRSGSRGRITSRSGRRRKEEEEDAEAKEEEEEEEVGEEDNEHLACLASRVQGC